MLAKPKRSRASSTSTSRKRRACATPSTAEDAKSRRRDRQRILELKAANQQLRREKRECLRDLEAVEENEAQFRALAENSLNGVYIYGRGHMLYVNSAFAQIFGYDSNEIVRMNPYLMVHPDDRALAAEHIRCRMAGEVEWSQYRFRGLRKDGSIVYCEALGRYSTYRGEPAILGNMLNITERILAEEALRKSEETLRKLTAEADRRLESERARIARELHDGLGQVLTALNMDLAWIGKRVPSDNAAVKARVEESITYVRQMTSIIRSLCKTLHPVVLDHNGLVEAVRTQVSEFKQYSQIRCELTIHPQNLELSGPVAIAVFRIIQEGLTNVARHSQASSCWVSLRLKSRSLTIRVRDNGVGSTPSRLSGSKSLGIVGMKERAAALGGTFQIGNMRSRGVGLIVRLPLAP